jgi:TetR/AcrR family transcriptional regulator
MVTHTQEKKQTEARRHILKTAEKIFARDGYAGARMDEIARAAKVNKAMIYYHIGNKEALYAEVLHHIFSDALARFKTRIRKEASPEENLRQFIRNIGLTVGQNPGAAAILMREQATGGQSLPEVIMRDLYTILMLLVEILDSGSRQGVFTAVNPFAVHMLTVGSILLTHTSYPIRTRIPAEQAEVDLHKQQPLETTLKDIEALIMGAVLKSPVN